MPELDAIGSGLLRALGVLIRAAIVFAAYRFTRDNLTVSPRGYAKAAAWVIGLAIVAAYWQGTPYCMGGDQMFGCDEYSEGYEVSRLKRFDTFGFFLVFLGVPVLYGAVEARRTSRRG